MRNKFLGLLVASTALAACNNNVGSSGSSPATPQSLAKSNLAKSFNLRNQLLKGNAIVPPRLGFGYDSRTGIAYTANCLANQDKPDSIQYINPEGRINFTSTVSSSDMSSMLNANLHGEANFGLFSASITASYAKENSEQRNSLAYNFAQTFYINATYKDPGFGNKKALTQDAQDAIQVGSDAGKGLALFNQYCGDSYVNTAKVGAVLMVSVKLEFMSAHEKESFEGSASGSLAGLGSISGAFKNGKDTSTKNAHFVISAIQLGGDPTKLANVFGSPDMSNGYPIVKCSPTNFDACEAVINNVIAYTQNEFQKSIDLNDPSKYKNYYTFDTATRKYSDLGVEKADFPKLSESALAAKNYLSTQIEADQEMLDYLQRYQNQPFYNGNVDQVTKDYVTQAVKDYSSIVGLYTQYNVLSACYGSGLEIDKRCVEVANQIKGLHSQYQTSIDLANRLSYSVAVNTPIGNLKLIPTTGTTNNEPAIYGGFLAYRQADNLTLATCVIDTTSAHNYFNQYWPSLGTKIGYCYPLAGSGIDPLYIYRSTDGNAIDAIMGHMVNSQEVNYPLDQTSTLNAQFFYPPASAPFMFNPI